MMANTNVALPKFGSWDVNNLAAAGDYTMIFNRARVAKRADRAGKDAQSRDSPTSRDTAPLTNQRVHNHKRHTNKRWLCCSAKYAEA